MKKIFLILTASLFFTSCTKKEGHDVTLNDSFISGELAQVAKERQLEPKHLVAAAKTYSPSGAKNEYLALMGTGVSGRLVVMSMPAMKILKYVAVFSAEPWQGFAFDDQSKAITKASARDEIEYAYGDSEKPTTSLTNGKHDTRAVFLADAANGRIGLVDLAEYETKQIVSHPIFYNSTPDLAVTENTRYVTQTSAIADEKKRLGMTFWHFVEKTHEEHKVYMIDPATSYTILLSGQTQSPPATGKGPSEGIALSITHGDNDTLNVVNWKKADSILATHATLENTHLTIQEEIASEKDIVKKYSLPKGSNKILISGDGQTALITNRQTSKIMLIDMTKLMAGILETKEMDIGSIAVDGSFTAKNLYVTTYQPATLVKINLKNNKVEESLELDFIAGKIFIPEEDTSDDHEKYAVIANLNPQGRYTPVGPQGGLIAHLVDISQKKMIGLYDAVIPQTTRMDGVAISTKKNTPVYKYKIGTDPRTGQISPYKTGSGKETIIRNGKRVHVFATLIRSHISPDYIEVEQGDIVSIHLTSNEQSKDNVHGFTIDTYNVHGSFEPGKTASFTFVADRAGVFPFYCTEFCSALHLEMQGYLLVKPMSNKQVAKSEELIRMQQNSQMNSFFKYIKGN